VTAVRANDFAAQWDEVGPDVLAAVDRVGRSGWLVLGEEVERFERELAQWWGSRHAVGVASGMDALEIAMRCAGVEAGDKVLTTPLTAFATTLAILRIGATPVWVDTDAAGNLDLDRAADALAGDPGISALLPVHLYGHPLDPNALATLVERFGVTLVEDCAQSAGASRDGRPTGTIGALAATSLYPTKNLGAYGDGGVVLTDDGDLAERARVLRNYGQADRYSHVEPGLNSRLDELQAAILRTALLPRLDAWLKRRAAIAARYDAALDGSQLRPLRPSGGSSAHHLFPVEILGDAPDALRERLAADGIGVGRHYPTLCPDQPACGGAGVTIGELANARRIADRELSLPIHPQLDDAAVEGVIDACRATVAG
jgi:dTDP-4-amino-4,6-dideoxygalactose transaminase